jgi:uncharacterized protein (DUF427 family)
MGTSRDGVESVWDYPRPPAVVASDEHVVVEFGGRVIAESRRALRVLETSHPPVYYLPLGDVVGGVLDASSQTSWCEYKGTARYYSLVGPDGRRVEQAAWGYPEPVAAYAGLRGHVAFYPGRVDRCLVDGEVVRAQDGGFYGGWVTDRITGPFKGGPGTTGW